MNDNNTPAPKNREQVLVLAHRAASLAARLMDVASDLRDGGTTELAGTRNTLRDMLNLCDA